MMLTITTKLLHISKKYIPQRRRQEGRRSQIPRDRKVLLRKRTKLSKPINKMEIEEIEDKKSQLK